MLILVCVFRKMNKAEKSYIHHLKQFYNILYFAIYQYALNMYMYLATFNSFGLERYVS